MKKYNDILIRQNDAANSTDGSDNVQPATKVWITLAGTRTIVDLYDGPDEATANNIANPVTTDDYGRLSFYVADGDYDFYININTDLEFKVKSNEPIYDISEASIKNAKLLTIAEANNESLKVGQYIRLTDRLNALYIVKQASSPTGYITVDIGGGLMIEAVLDSGFINLGHITSTGQDDSVALEYAWRHLCKQSDPGGTIHLPKTKRWSFNRELNTVKILFEEQGMTYPPVASGAYLPNGEIARNVMFRLTGDATQVTTSPLLNGVFLRVGNRDNLTGYGQAHKCIVEGIEAIASGSIGHQHVIIMENKHTVLANPSMGTSNVTDTFLRLENVIPGSYADALDVRLYNIGVECFYGFGFEYRSGSVQYCNQGVVGRVGFTNLTLTKALETELCAIGVYLEQVTDAVLDNINEANNLALGMYSCRMIDCSSWMEGNIVDVLMDSINSGAFNRQIKFESSIGPSNFQSFGGLVGLYVKNAPIGTEWYFNIPAFNRFEDIRFSYNDFDTQSDGVDLSNFQVISNEYSLDDITIEGRVKNQTFSTFGMTLPKVVNRGAATALQTPQPAVQFRVENEEIYARFIIDGMKVPSDKVAQDVQAQTFKYVGVITRTKNQNVVVSIDTENSNVFDHVSTGTNVPITVETPAATIRSGTTTSQQDVSLDFATGTAVSGTAECYFTVTLFSDQSLVYVL